jgi:membrane-associated phospholipid phosphatase
MITRVRSLAVLAGTAVAVGVGTLAWSPAGGVRGVASAANGVNDSAHADAAARQAFTAGSGRLVVDWNTELLHIERTAGAQPASIHPTRSFALLQSAMYDAVVSITRADAAYTFDVEAPTHARPDAAADQAAHDVLVALFPSFATQLDGMLASELSTIPADVARQAGEAVGSRVATLMLALRAGDGSANPAPLFVAGNQPGNYQVTPPNVGKQPVFTGWGKVTPWALDSASQFRPGPPPALTSAAWATAINQVESLGGGQGTPSARTADQTQIGLFWGPPIWNTWNEIAGRQVIARRTNLETASHLFADLDITFADGAIAFYDAKYTYAFWRPITAIRAGTPNNAAVDPANPTWNPQVATALDPSYPGAHATISEAGATILTRFFGPRVDLTVHSDAAGFANVTRSFSSFQAAADEAALSRILAGQHTSIDEAAGTSLGGDIAGFVLAQPFGRR